MNDRNFSLRFLRWFCPDHLYEEIEGDLIQKFNRDVKNFGEKRAKRRLVWNTIRFFRPGILFRNAFDSTSNDFAVFINLLQSYLLVSFRNAKKHKVISIINVVGLAIGMSVSLLVLVMLKGQFSFDNFHPDSERTYRVYSQVSDSEGNHFKYASSPLPLAGALKDNYAFVENVVRVYPAPYADVILNETKIPLKGAFTDNSFFDVFGFDRVIGSLKPFQSPNAVILKEEVARNIFGNENPLQRIITIGELGEFVVTDLIRSTKKKSHLNYDFYISMASVVSLEASGKLSNSIDSWTGYLKGYTYVVLKPETSQTTFDDALKSISDNVAKRSPLHNGERYDQFSTQLVEDIKFSTLLFDKGVGMGMQDLAFIISIGLIILLLAVFNYTNLTVGRSFNRMKEIAVRRTSGAKQLHIFGQLIVESILFSLLGVMIAFCIAQFLPLNYSFERYIKDVTLDATLVGWVVIFSIGVGILAGIFPAFILSKINPLHALRGASSIKLFKAVTIRKVLIVIQFALSLIFIVVFLVVYQQSEFQVKTDYGFNRDNIITIPLQHRDYQVLQNKLGELSCIDKISACSQLFGWGNDVMVRQTEHDSIKMEYYSVDEHFISLLKVPLITGNDFRKEGTKDSEVEVLINEQAVKALHLGLPVDAIGKSVVLDDTASVIIAGVFRDFNNHSFKHAVKPLMLRYRKKEFHGINVRFHEGNFQIASANIKRILMEENPAIESKFLLFNQEFSDQQSHTDDLAMIGILAIIAISISCLGLLGVVIYSIEIRTKEIGIRKVFGATVKDLTLQLSGNFLMLLIIAGFLSLPIGYWIGEVFLKQFVYKIDLGFPLLATGFAIILLPGLITICSQTTRAALSNPVKTLKV